MDKMKNVLISIRPQWCEKITSGEKTIEVRKSAPKEVPFKVYIYCTKHGKQFFHNGIGEKECLFKNPDTGKIKFDYAFEVMCCKNDYSKDNFLSGKVIGEFICDKVDEYNFHNGLTEFNSMGLPSRIYGSYLIFTDDYKSMCLSYDEVKDYGKGKPIYGWHISDLKIYDEPKQISDFLKPCPDPYQYCTICKHCVQIIPPDEEEYAFYHGGHYDYCEEHCTNILRNPPKGWCYVKELEK